MQCVRPPLQKKPARGFGWACGPCNLAQERKLEALNAPHLHDSGSHVSAEDEELLEEEEEEDPAQANTNRTSPDVEHDHPPPTPEQIYQASLWPFRYLGMHCRSDDALDLDDRIYPRASSRLGPRHQATVGNWPGRPVQFVKPLEIKKTGRKDGRHSKEIQALLEKDKREREQRPKWVQDEPFPGYVPRGLDIAEDDPNCTSTCLWKPAEDEDGEPVKDADNDLIISEAGIDDYMNRARSMTKELGLPDRSTNLEDVARDLLYKNHYDAEESLRQLAETDKSLFKEPELTVAEQKKFEEAVAKFGSELQSVKRHVKSVPHKFIVRHYYKWKKTTQGKKIWGNHPQRKGKKEIKRAQAEASKAADEVADDHDDSAFDTVKARDRKKNFMCKFCSTKTSRQWRRAPNVSSAVVTENGGKNKDKGTQYVVALCRRCAELWRRYAIQWEDLDEAAKKLASSGNRSWKKKIDEELFKELQAADERMSATKYSTPEPAAVPPNAAATTAAQMAGPQEPPRKKLKSDRDSEPALPETGGVGSVAATKKKEKEKEKPVEKPAPPPPPPMPKPKTMPCSICRQLEPLGDQHLQCRECRMTVHRNCYGVVDNRQNGRWICDMCSNDKNPQISLVRRCIISFSLDVKLTICAALQVCIVPGREDRARLCGASEDLSQEKVGERARARTAGEGVCAEGSRFLSKAPGGARATVGPQGTAEEDGRQQLGPRNLRRLHPRGKVRKREVPRAQRRHPLHPPVALSRGVQSLQAARRRLCTMSQSDLSNDVPCRVRLPTRLCCWVRHYSRQGFTSGPAQYCQHRWRKWDNDSSHLV